MKIPLKWLADYVAIDMPVAELAQRLTMAGLEVSSYRSFGLPAPDDLRLRGEEAGPVWDRDRVIIGQLTAVEKHPNADKLKLPVVDLGAGRSLQLVTGAPNIQVGERGQKVVVGLAGTVFWDGHVSPKKLTELKPKPVRGIPSEGMVMSAFELGINDEHEGIILLDADAPVGTPLADYWGDIVLEVDVLPNMARCLALLGVAREVAAFTGKSICRPVTTPQADGPPIEGRVQVQIDDPALSARYAAALIEGVKIQPSPGWMQQRLTYAGMRPISNIVDITNYVMLEWGQPLHAFDYDVLKRRAGGKAPTIIVRPARAGEVLKTLDGVERKLTPDMLVIADTAGAIALAGVMGGLETEVTASTTNILLESASFDFLNIRRTMRALDHHSDAGLRFSRGVHPALVPLALGRAAELMRQHAGGTVARGIVDVYPAPRADQVVELTSGEIRRLLGMDIPLEECERVLRTLEFTVERIRPDALRATVPPYRLDVQEGPADLIEDLVRLVGYDRLPETRISEGLPDSIQEEAVAFEEKVRDRLVALGLQEIITYALTTPEREAPLGLPARDYVQLLNPISSERTAMRQSLLTGALEVAEQNLRQGDEIRLFEVGSVYLTRPDHKLPDEPRRLAIVLSGRRYQDHWGDAGQTPRGQLDFFDLKGVVAALLADLHLRDVVYRPGQIAALHPGKSAEIVAGDRVLGYLGELHPRVGEAFALGGKTVLVAEIDLAALQAALPPRYAYVSVSRFPAALRDVAVIVPEALPAEKVEAEIRAAGGALLRGLRLFDLYRGESIPAGTKSLAYALAYQADDRTLTDKEVEKAHKAIESRLRHVLKAQIRGQDA
ncbi:MAG: phenylalanine--tRNA ligase subunit beta [Gemmataceae bacterium]